MVLHGWLSGKKLPLTVAQLHDIVIEITCCLDLNEDGSRVSFSATTTVWCRSARTDRDVIGRSTLTAFVHPMDFLRAWECCDKEVEAATYKAAKSSNRCILADSHKLVQAEGVASGRGHFVSGSMGPHTSASPQRPTATRSEGSRGPAGRAPLHGSTEEPTEKWRLWVASELEGKR